MMMGFHLPLVALVALALVALVALAAAREAAAREAAQIWRGVCVCALLAPAVSQRAGDPSLNRLRPQRRINR